MTNNVTFTIEGKFHFTCSQSETGYQVDIHRDPNPELIASGVGASQYEALGKAMFAVKEFLDREAYSHVQSEAAADSGSAGFEVISQQMQQLQSAAIISPANAGLVAQMAYWDSRIAQDLAFSPIAQLLAIASHETIELFEVQSGRKIRSLIGHVKQISRIAFAPDGRKLASRAKDAVKLWDIKNGNELHTLEVRSVCEGGLEFSPDGRILVWGEDRILKVLETATWHELRRLSGHTSEVRGLAFSPDGKMIASSSTSDGTVKLWEATSGREIRTLRLGPVDKMAFSSDGGLLALCTNEGVDLWDTSNWREFHLPFGYDWVNCVAFSPDGRLLASGSMDAIRLWDTESGLELRTLPDENCACMAFSPDGRILASGGSSGTRLWGAMP